MGEINYEQDGRIPKWLFFWVLKHVNKVEIRQDTKWTVWVKK